MTIDTDRINDVISRILKPQTDADRDLMWTAALAMLVGIIIG